MKLSVCMLVLLFSFSVLAQQAVAQDIADSALIKSRGTQLYVELRGQAKHKPILLFLHGGPGNAFGLISFRAYVGPQLESRFLVAYLHQRGVLSSPAVPDSTQTLSNHVADVKNVVAYLRKRFPGRRIYLLGHSWGGTLAVLCSVENPHLVDGVIDAAGPFNTKAGLKASYASTLNWATSTANAEAIKELKALGPPPFKDFSGQITLSTWASSANGGLDAHLSEAKLISREPFTSLKPEWQDTQIRISKAMYETVEQLNMEPRLKTQRAPLLMIVGAKDTVVPPAGVRPGYNAYGGRKKWVELKESHHLAFVDEPDAFVKAIADFVR